MPNVWQAAKETARANTQVRSVLPRQRRGKRKCVFIRLFVWTRTTNDSLKVARHRWVMGKYSLCQCRRRGEWAVTHTHTHIHTYCTMNMYYSVQYHCILCTLNDAWFDFHCGNFNVAQKVYRRTAMRWRDIRRSCCTFLYSRRSSGVHRHCCLSTTTKPTYSCIYSKTINR